MMHDTVVLPSPREATSIYFPLLLAAATTNAVSVICTEVYL